MSCVLWVAFVVLELIQTRAKKNQAPGQKTKRYRRDLDQIHEDVTDKGKQKLAFDLERKDIEDLPDESALSTHLKGKPHKKRLKLLKEEPYTIEESRRAVGLGVDKGEFTKRRQQQKDEQDNTQVATMTTDQS
ncbi:hypothetical protein OIO90_005280 [Microbotryomycetes sp. JL221]|nr:hypothetical protein OIO90_005280 [Microbotryomycetes sp. JL221]